MKKLRQKKGFTLMEMLCALLVLVLASGAMITEISFATRTYKESVDVSQAQVLCSTLTTTVSEELRYADNPVQTEEICSFSSIHHGDNAFFGQNSDGKVTLGGSEILSPSAYTSGMKAQVELTYSSNTYTAEIKVTNSKGEELAKNKFAVQALITK